ncbi:MAG TPA: hypothetical protein VFD92_23535 [Candidatus Binatia bacterium]|nr:hypothetical protein [Candidatus Binatia bacterium]
MKRIMTMVALAAAALAATSSPASANRDGKSYGGAFCATNQPAKTTFSFGRVHHSSDQGVLRLECPIVTDWGRTDSVRVRVISRNDTVSVNGGRPGVYCSFEIWSAAEIFAGFSDPRTVAEPFRNAVQELAFGGFPMTSPGYKNLYCKLPPRRIAGDPQSESSIVQYEVVERDD